MHTLEQLQSGALVGAKNLRLSSGLAVFPREIFDLADTLEILDLSGNDLSALPDDLHNLKKLRILFASNNSFTALPAALGQCPALTMISFKANRISTIAAEALPTGLRWLILTDNNLDTLPEAIGQCRELQKLMLAGNELTTLPDNLARCTRLELLRLSDNRLPALPAWLTAMPRLSWLAFAGNPFTVEAESSLAGPALDWDDLTLEATLGEGASGVIHGATCGNDTLPLAVKVFKGKVTSDGLPKDEMRACLRAGVHPNIIPVIGRITGHPQGLDALALRRIDSAFAPLASPPSLDTCTRDVYAAGKRFTAETALLIAAGMASAARHLHDRGLMHGDLYAHNILHASGREAVIGDFGAASIYSLEDTVHSHALQRLEVRAFGCLLEELTTRSDAAASVVEGLWRIAVDCLDEDPAVRPLFAEIEDRLAALSATRSPRP